MKKKNSAAVKLGKIKTAKKATAARENGRKGGRKESQALRDARMEAFQALRVIYEIRVAAGDPEGKFMIPELISEIATMRGCRWVQGWIKCSDRKPRTGERVLAKYEGVYGPRVVTFWADGVNDHYGDPPESQPATHWCPLPA